MHASRSRPARVSGSEHTGSVTPDKVCKFTKTYLERLIYNIDQGPTGLDSRPDDLWTLSFVAGLFCKKLRPICRLITDHRSYLNSLQQLKSD